jgi:hypothetical protein
LVNHSERPCFTQRLLDQIRALQTRLKHGLAAAAVSDSMPVRTIVWGSTFAGCGPGSRRSTTRFAVSACGIKKVPESGRTGRPRWRGPAPGQAWQRFMDPARFVFLERPAPRPTWPGVTAAAHRISAPGRGCAGNGPVRES